MEQQQRTLIIFTFFLALIGITLIVVSLATDNWVESNPQTLKNKTSGSESQKSDVNFGLFKGYRILNYGFGQRKSGLSGDKIVINHNL
jgi:hypothetical protein